MFMYTLFKKIMILKIGKKIFLQIKPFWKVREIKKYFFEFYSTKFTTYSMSFVGYILTVTPRYSTLNGKKYNL